MDSSKELELEARLASVEESIAALQRSLETLLSDRTEPPIAGWAYRNSRRAKRDPLAYQVRAGSGETPRATIADEIGANLSSWFASRTPEWWLSRVGMGLVILAVLILYGYAIDKGWITPPIRVLAGTLVGAVLFWAAIHTPARLNPAEPRALGMRELLFGGALAVLYVTAYAAAVWYQLISIPSARLLYFVLAILSTLIALQERREIFAFVAVATGFATPFILTAPVSSTAELSLYLALMTVMGLTIYLMRGWPSIVWITFIAFWLGVAGATNYGLELNPANRSFALTALLILGTAAFVRVPVLRRQLLLLGSDRYTPFPLSRGLMRLMDGLDSLAAAVGGGKSAPDSLVLWVLPLLSPILAVDFLHDIWPTAPKELWGVGLLVLGVAAFAMARRGADHDAESTHVEITAAVLWAALGVSRVATTPEGIPLTAFIATFVLMSSVRAYAGPRTVAKATIAIALLSIAGHGLGFADAGLINLRWVLSGIATVGCAGVIAQTLIEDPAEKVQGIVLGIAAYLTGLIVVWQALDPVWPPLVTTSYAGVGATLLVMSRRPGANPLLRNLGGATMLVVVARLLFVDLSSVDTIWRVLLFLVCGALFLYTGYRMQPRAIAETDE
jgi:uncharacterized membrane protein